MKIVIARSQDKLVFLSGSFESSDILTAAQNQSLGELGSHEILLESGGGSQHPTSSVEVRTALCSALPMPPSPLECRIHPSSSPLTLAEPHRSRTAVPASFPFPGFEFSVESAPLLSAASPFHTPRGSGCEQTKPHPKPSMREGVEVGPRTPDNQEPPASPAR